MGWVGRVYGYVALVLGGVTLTSILSQDGRGGKSGRGVTPIPSEDSGQAEPSPVKGEGRKREGGYIMRAMILSDCSLVIPRERNPRGPPSFKTGS